MAMTLRERKKLQRDFFEAAGPNTAAFCAMVDTFPDACFYMKDLECRIMALNKRNCEVCNIKNELDVVGLRSDEVFTSNYRHGDCRNFRGRPDHRQEARHGHHYGSV